jgi:hypothetical protein
LYHFNLKLPKRELDALMSMLDSVMPMILRFAVASAHRIRLCDSLAPY